MKVVFFWLVVVFMLSVYGDQILTIRFQGADKVFHFLIYAITCALFFVELKKPLRKLSLPVLLGICVVLASAYGLLMEVLQEMYFSRTFSLYDALANSLGAVAAAVMIAIMRKGK